MSLQRKENNLRKAQARLDRIQNPPRWKVVSHLKAREFQIDYRREPNRHGRYRTRAYIVRGAKAYHGNNRGLIHKAVNLKYRVQGDKPSVTRTIKSWQPKTMKGKLFKANARAVNFAVHDVTQTAVDTALAAETVGLKTSDTAQREVRNKLKQKYTREAVDDYHRGVFLMGRTAVDAVKGTHHHLKTKKQHKLEKAKFQLKKADNKLYKSKIGKPKLRANKAALRGAKAEYKAKKKPAHGNKLRKAMNKRRLQAYKQTKRELKFERKQLRTENKFRVKEFRNQKKISKLTRPGLLALKPATYTAGRMKASAYNMIDGIINNGSKEDIDKAKAELAEGIKSMESLADNPFVSEEVRASAADELAKMKKQLELLDSADEVQVDSWLSAMIENGDAVLTDDGGFKVNPDYYKELPRNDRHVETMTEIQAVEVMSALTAAGVAYSAATKGEDKVGITVSKADVPALNDVMYASIGKIAHTEAAKENGGKGEKGKYQTINPEYYASLGKDDKHTRVEPIGTARKIVAELQKQNIPYSAVVRKNDTVAVTVSKANAEAYKQIESAVKGERAVEYVNPDFFKSLPKQERFTQRMDEGQARKKSAELTAKGVEHSAVFGGEKSAVTVAKKDSQRAFFSRGRMQRDAQRMPMK